MTGINLYPEMNKEIVNIFRLSPDNPMNMYAAALIESLTEENEKLKRIIKLAPRACGYCKHCDEVGNSGQEEVCLNCVDGEQNNWEYNGKDSLY